MRLREYRDPVVPPEGYENFLRVASADDFRFGWPWLKAVMQYGAPAGDLPILFGFESDAGLPLAMVQAFASASYAEGVRASSLLLVQTSEMPYQPLASGDVSVVDLVQCIARHAKRSNTRYAALRVSPLDSDSAAFDGLPRVLRKEGWLCHRFLMYPNRYERVAGLTSAAFLSARSGRLQNTVERRARALDRSGRAQVEVVTGGPGLESAMHNFELVFVRSWKKGLTDAAYLRALMQVAAQAEALRLAFLYIDGRPAAAQFWVIAAGTAYLCRLAYDEQFRELSPGTVLTWHVIRRLLDVDQVNELDFGIGDDTYKTDWAASRRERWGVVGFNPRTFGGLRATVRSIAGRTMKHALRIVGQRAGDVGN